MWVYIVVSEECYGGKPMAFAAKHEAEAYAEEANRRSDYQIDHIVQEVFVN
jgi:hypothetical protein